MLKTLKLNVRLKVYFTVYIYCAMKECYIKDIKATCHLQRVIQKNWSGECLTAGRRRCDPSCMSYYYKYFVKFYADNVCLSFVPIF